MLSTARLAPASGYRTGPDLFLRGRHIRRSADRWPIPRPADLLAIVVLLVVAGLDLQLPVIRPALGAWVVIGLPVRLLLAKLAWRSAVAAERIVFAVAGVLLTLMVGGLGLNTIGPVLGVDRPLATLPVTLMVTLAVLSLSAWRPDRPGRRDWRRAPDFVRSLIPLLRRALSVDGVRVPWPAVDTGVLGLSVLAVLVAVAGANRLNNLRSGAVATLALILVLIVFTLLLSLRGRLRESTVASCVYLLSLALLFGTSLRGWHVSGHDIQREYRVFEATLAAGRWQTGTFHDAYNACLSITVLPTVLEQILHVDPPYVYKVFFQLVFAFTPVAVYRMARRTSSIGTALIGVLFFMSFPTFFTDMAFLNRQEIAFVFLAAALLAITQNGIAVFHRRLVFGAFAFGTVLSHYSTAYILIGVTALAAVLREALIQGAAVLPHRMLWMNRRVDDSGPYLRRTRAVVSTSSVLVLLASVALWSGLVTRTSGQLVQTLSESVIEVLHPGTSDSKSTDVAYNLLPTAPVPPQQRLDEGVQKAYAETAAERTVDGDLLPREQVEKYPLTVVPAPDLPLTALGRVMATVGLSPGPINAVVRQAAAKMLQVFVLVGLLALAFGYRERFKPTSEVVLLGVASFAVVVSQVVLPQISADYGVLRAFQQALMLLAPFLATGMVICFRWLRSWSDRAAAGFALVFQASLIGIVPQLTGGYPAQLQLNNSGTYYDAYYTQTAELAAVQWLGVDAPGARDNVQFSALTDRLTSPLLASHLGTSPREDLFPPYLRRSSYVLLDASTARRKIGVISVSGDMMEYTYPVELLQKTRNLVYNNGTAQVYR